MEVFLTWNKDVVFNKTISGRVQSAVIEQGFSRDIFKISVLSTYKNYFQIEVNFRLIVL